MKGKNLQPSILYPVRLFQILWRNQKIFRQAKVKRIQHHESSLTTNAKGTSLGRKQGRKSPQFSSVQFSLSVVSDSPWPYGLQHTRFPCPSATSGVYSNSCPLSQWCHPTISSPVIPFSSHLQYFSASGSLPISQLFPSGGQCIGVSASVSVLPIFWLPNVKNRLFGKDPDVGKDWRKEEKGMTEDEVVGWHHGHEGHAFK